MRDLDSPEAALDLKRLREREIQTRYARLAQGGRQTAAQEAAETAEMTEVEEAYQIQLKEIEDLRVILARLLPAGNPLEASRSVRSSTPWGA